MLRKLILVFLSILLMLFITSCWDMVEIERYAFVLGIALDKADNGDEIEVTFQIAKPRAFNNNGGAEEFYWNITEKEKDITEAQKMLTKSINQIPTLEHCQVILLGESIVKEGLGENLDYLLRTHEVRRRVLLAVVQGRAKDILDMEFHTSVLPSFVIAEMLQENSKYALELTNYMNLGRLHMADISGYDFILARILPMDNKIDVSGGGAFRDMKLVGWLTGEEMMGIRFLRGDLGSGYLTVQLPDDLGDHAMLKIFNAQSKLEPEIREDKLYVNLDLRIEGDITEIVRDDLEIEEEEFLSRLERIMEENIKHRVKKAFNKTLKEFNCEPFMLKEKAKSYYPDFWRKNQSHWEEVYKSAVLEIEARVQIRRVGEIRH